MLEVNQDLLADAQGHNIAICIPTNGNVKKDGKAVMGAGVAKLVRDAYPGCDAVLGGLLAARGHRVQQFWKEPCLVSFPTKVNWQEDSLLELIEQSCKELVNLQSKKNFDKLYLCRFGCGYGGLQWEVVKPILELYFDNEKYIVCHRES